MSVENLNQIINEILIPVIKIGYPIAIFMALIEKLLNFILNCIKGKEEVKF